MSISRSLIEPHLKALWWWQRGRVLTVVTECLECIESGNEAKVYDLLNGLSGKSRRVAMLALCDCLRYVQFTGEQILDALGRSGQNQ